MKTIWDKVHLSWQDVRDRAERIGRELCDRFPKRVIYAYPVPRGGIHAAQAVQAVSCLQRQLRVELVEAPEEANVLIDDIVDSGKTRGTLISAWKKPFYALVDKTVEKELGWVVFPWERMTCEAGGPEENVRRLIEFIGDDPNREGLQETPERVVRSYEELFAGYKQDVAEVVKMFESSCDEMVIVRDVEFYSTCEHHFLPFFGKAHIAYIPDGRMIGVSKLIRVLEVFSRRLQIQERLCQQVTDALDEFLNPKGSACVLEAQHFCMTSRGVQKQHSIMVTSSLTGAFREKGNAARQEFLSMIGKV